MSVAQVVIVEHTLATATCFDPSVTKAVQTALYQQLELNASISEDGVLRIPLPKVSMETRQKTAAVLQKRAESVRQRIRKVRRKALSTVKQGVAGKLEGISKDDAFRVQQEIEAIVEEVIQTLNKAAEEKHDSIMLV
jgi:ribosome recycling factor